MRKLSVVVVFLLACHCCQLGNEADKNCVIGLNLKQSRAKVLKEIDVKIDSLENYLQKKAKGKTKSTIRMCETRLEEFKKLREDYHNLPGVFESQPGFRYTEKRLMMALSHYGLDTYIDIAESWCRDQLVFLDGTFSSPDNELYQNKRVVQYLQKQKYKTAPDAKVFITTYEQVPQDNIVPNRIYVVFYLRDGSFSNPNDESRLKSLRPYDRVFIEGEFDGFKRKRINTDLGGGVNRPEVYCAFLKNWTIISPEYVSNKLKS
mgnify:FL=1